MKKHRFLSLMAIVLVIALTGCAAVSSYFSIQHLRHPYRSLLRQE